MNSATEAPTREALISCVGSADVREIIITEHLDDLPALRLGPGQSLKGRGNPVLRFSEGADGVQLTADNLIQDLTLATDIERRAVYNDTGFAGFGRIQLVHLRVVGCVRILAENKTSAGHFSAVNVLIEAADATRYEHRPSGYGVEVVPGAFMVWNRQSDPASLVTADLAGIGVGQRGKPVHGSGVFVAGLPGGERTLVTRLETDEVHCHGGIALGTADRIAGGVFVVSGAHAHSVRNRGPVTTYGPNDMVLDNWGSVDSWQADDRIMSLGPSHVNLKFAT